MITDEEKNYINSFDWYHGNLDWLKRNTIFLCRTGSHAYGTNTPTSDLDVRGIVVPPVRYWLGFKSSFDQTVINEPVDCTIFNIRKWFALAADCNPNILELLYTDSSNFYKCHGLWEIVISIKEQFLSKKCRYTYAGYAHSQLKRIQTHRRWLLNPPKAQPTRKDFGLPENGVVARDQIKAAESAIRKQLDGLGGLGLNKDEQEVHYELAAKNLGYDTNFIELLKREHAYGVRQKEWEQFLTWKKERNAVRSELEAKFGYDCYDADTEFLTENGWKKFDEILSTDKLGTIRINSDRKDIPFGALEFQSYTDRFDSIYNGPMYKVQGIHLECCVTSNHRMLYQERERNSDKKYNWVLDEVAQLPDCFNFLARCTPKLRAFKNPPELKEVTSLPLNSLLRLMGWYLSDGCMQYTENNEPKSIRISQKVDGKLYQSMVKFSKRFGCSLFKYERQPNNFNPHIHEEAVLMISNPDVVRFINKYCGSLDNKHIPRFIYSCGYGLMQILFDAMVLGDGTIRRHKTKSDSIVYYSKLKQLANDVNELAVHCGWETALWGPYTENNQGYTIQMYQVHVRKGVKQEKTLVRSCNVTKENVTGKRVVCFSVPNSTLVTRYNGKISFHGNCKHAAQLVRLYRTCHEILTQHKLQVRRPDAEELLAIRNGAWTYEQLIEWANNQEKLVEEAYRTSTLQNSVDVDGLEMVMVALVERVHEGRLDDE